MKNLLWLLTICIFGGCNPAVENKPQPQQLVTTDSFEAYIKTNFDLYMSLPDSQPQVADQHLVNIITQHERALQQPATKKILAMAYAWHGFNNYSSDIYKEDAIKSLEQFLLLSKEDTINVYKAIAYQQLGIQYQILGDLSRSAVYYTQFNNYYFNSADKYASGVINTSILLNELGLYDSSVNMINNVLARKDIVPKRLAALHSQLATAQSKMHLYKEAIANAQTALNIIKQLKRREIDEEILEKKYQSLWNLGEIQSLSGDDASAARTLDQALHVAFINFNNSYKNREAGKMLIARGKVAEKTGLLHEALLYYHKALASVTDVDPGKTEQVPGQKSLYTENTIMEALDAKADLLQKLYAEDKDTAHLILAVQCYKIAFEVESRLMQGFGYDESLARQAKESRNRSEKAITACYELYHLTRQPGWAEIAFLFAEKSKSLVLLESIRKSMAANNTLQNDSLLQKVQLLQLKAAYYEKQLYINPDTSAARLVQQKNETEKELLTAKTALLLGNSNYKKALLKPDTLSLLALKNSLPANTAVAEFFEGKEHVWSFIISGALPVQFLQHDSALVTLTDSLIGYFTNASFISNDPSGFLQTAFKVYSAFQWQQVDSQWRQVIIIPDGRFSFLPFDALVTQQPATPDLQQAPYLVRKYLSSYAYSAAILLGQLQQTFMNDKKLAVFAPVFANREHLQQSLPNTKNEIEGIAKYKQGNFFTSGNATLSNFRNELGNAGILHIATHAYADTSARPMPRIEFIDSSLLLNELYALQTKASLVVLSACETGIGKISKSEGPLSLARGFYYAGAGNVITSLWNVDDKSTALLFTDFYRNIDNLDYPGALASAKLNYLKHASPTNASPYYWAAFVHIGYAAPRTGASWWWLAIPALAVASAILFYLKRSWQGNKN